jgi:hypothetical protein
VRSQSKNLMPESSPADTRPIELVTDNGFSILRLWEINREALPSSGAYDFLVRNPRSLERLIMVEILDELVVDIELRTRRRILPGSAYWICCAERHLAIYLWENNGYPPGDRLCVDRLDAEDVMSAIRWGRADGKSSGTDFSL